jgi:pimeloyl-ACP methyl ester carboxylesterase
MTADQKNRYRIDEFHAKSLEGNPLKSPVDRNIHVYLPPGYYEHDELRYPVIYFLHGYAGDYRQVNVGGDVDKFAKLLPPEIMKEIGQGLMVDYTRFDDLISRGVLPPFIFVQPDSSLHMPHFKGVKDIFTGEVAVKGSFYVNSGSTGRYEDYIVNDVVAYIDASYQTVPRAKHRALAGASMGGYGALSISLNRPGIFAAVAALSPANFTVASISWKLIVPVQERLLGRQFAEESGAANFEDILDTIDLVYSADRPLVPTVKKDVNGKVISWDKAAAARWEKYNLNTRIARTKKPFEGASIFISCDKDDEFGLAPEATKIHLSLTAARLDHFFDLYADPAAALSPHIIGIGHQVLPAIKFCLDHLTFTV